MGGWFVGAALAVATMVSGLGGMQVGAAAPAHPAHTARIAHPAHRHTHHARQHSHRARHHRARDHRGRHHRAGLRGTRHHHPRHHVRHRTRPHLGMRGADIGWPQCRRLPHRAGHSSYPHGLGLPLPRPGTRFVLIGLTDGPAFHTNPCLGGQVRWARRQHRRVAAYAVASYPTRAELHRYGAAGPYAPHTLIGRLRNVGFRQARTNLAVMRRTGLVSPVVWIDVEPTSHPWSRHHRGLNRAVLRGLVHGYRTGGHRVGFYSTRLIWREIAGALRLRLPEWRTAGPVSPGSALATCRRPDYSIQGGQAVIGQWWTSRRDLDVLCPRARRHPGRFFHHY